MSTLRPPLIFSAPWHLAQVPSSTGRTTRWKMVAPSSPTAWPRAAGISSAMIIRAGTKGRSLQHASHLPIVCRLIDQAYHSLGGQAILWIVIAGRGGRWTVLYYAKRSAFRSVGKSRAQASVTARAPNPPSERRRQAPAIGPSHHSRTPPARSMPR